MESQFRKSAYDCLQRATWGVRNEEQTQEVKLPDAMPDIGRVLGAWGQPLLRSKEWRGNAMGLSGGVMVWVLYAPEDERMPRVVEAWLPFQLRFDFPQTQRDGSIVANCLLRGVDARSVSARKLMVRAVVSVAAEALEPGQVQLSVPEAMPEDVCLLKKTYPVEMRVEAGEKSFLIDEDLLLPESCKTVEKLVYYNIQPEIMEKKVMADRLVFRGTAKIHTLCRCADGTLQGCDFETPFSQYAELERQHSERAWAEIVPAVTSLEMEIAEDGSLRLKAGLIGQYTVSDRQTLEVVADAYSPYRQVQLQIQELGLPAVLERRQESIAAEHTCAMEGARMLDTCFNAGHPAQFREDGMLRLELTGAFQTLYYDNDGNLQGNSCPWEHSWQLPAAEDTTVLAVTGHHSQPEVAVELMTCADTVIPVVTAVEPEAMGELDPQRPSLILRKKGMASLWDLAKQCGSTVEAIQQANDLEAEAGEDCFLLIPVL